MADAATAGALGVGGLEMAVAMEAAVAELGAGLLAVATAPATLTVLAVVATGALIIFAASKIGSTSKECGESKKSDEEKPPKSESDIDKGRQDIHKPGTNEYKTRLASPKGKPTSWSNPEEADSATVEAYKKGRVTERFPDGAPKEVKWDAGRKVGEDGQTQVTVKLKQNGKMHGFPSGPKGGSQ